PDDLGREMDRIDEAEQRSLWIGVGRDDARGDLLAGGERGAGGGAIGGDVDLRDITGGARADLHAGGARRGGQRIDYGRGPAFREPPGRHGLPLARAEQQQDGGAAGGPRSEKRTENAARRDRRAQRLAVEPLAN